MTFTPRKSKSILFTAKLSTCSQVSFALFSQSKYVIERKQKRLFLLALLEIAVYKLQSNFSMLHTYEQTRLKGLRNEILKLEKFAPPKGKYLTFECFSKILLSARGVLVSIWRGSRYAVLLWSLKTEGAFFNFLMTPHTVKAWSRCLMMPFFSIPKSPTLIGFVVVITC